MLHLGIATDHQRRPRAVAKSHPNGRPIGNGNHIFNRATKLSANDIGAAIQPEITSGQLSLQPHAQCIVGAG